MDKTERLLRMMEQPERLRVGDDKSGISYTDEQLQELLSDEECRELYEAMRLSASAFEAEDAKQKIANGFMDEEWQKFLLRQANQFLDKPSDRVEREADLNSPPPTGGVRGGYNISLSCIDETSPIPSCRRGIGYRVAAAFIGLLMLSCIAYAAVQIVRHSKVGWDLKSPTQEVRISNSPQRQGEAQPADSTAQPVVYEDTELATIVNDIATFYQVEPVYKKEDSKHIRLYFTWDKHSSIDDIVDTFNKFERIHITRENKKLIVE